LFPSLQPLGAAILFSVPVNLITLLVPHRSGLIQCLSFCDWLISLSIMCSRFRGYCRIFFLFKGWIIFHCMDIPHFAYALIDAWLASMFKLLWRTQSDFHSHFPRVVDIESYFLSYSYLPPTLIYFGEVSVQVFSHLGGMTSYNLVLWYSYNWIWIFYQMQIFPSLWEIAI
jgi:hypothetical protein